MMGKIEHLRVYTMTWLWRFDDSMKTTLHHEMEHLSASKNLEGGCFSSRRKIECGRGGKDTQLPGEETSRLLQESKKEKGLG